MKTQGQKGKCKDDIKNYSLDCFEQVKRSKIKNSDVGKFFGIIYIWMAVLQKWGHTNRDSYPASTAIQSSYI